MRRDLSPGLAWLAAAGLVAGAGAAWVVSTAGPGRPTVPYAPLALPVALLVGWSFIGSGLLSWPPRAGNWLGPVLVLTGFAWFASMLLDAADPVVFTIGAAVYSLYYAGFLYLILSFPSGRLRGRPERVLMAATIGLVTVGQWAWLLFADSRRFICPTCPANLMEVAREDAATKLIYSVREACVIAVALAAIALLTGSPEAAELLAQTERQAAGALEELRELARGIYPPLLADLGLRAALEAQARKVAVPVTVEAPELGRYPQQTEAAVYFCVLEALQNVTKYAQAPAARVRLGHDGRCLTFTVEDDGTGFDRATTPMGTGLQGIADRMGALGGTIDIVSAPGHGTRVTGQVPAAAR
jgi:signal transduction histidine kinase